MAIINPRNRIIPKLTPMTPYEIYLLQVKGLYDNIRMTNRGFDYIPPQLGGIYNQRQVIGEEMVLELTDFEVS